MYLTQFSSDYISLSKGKLATNANNWHRLIWKLFPGRPEDKRDFLFRLYPEDTGIKCLIQSIHEPVKSDDFIKTEYFQVKALPASYFDRKTYHFDIVCNPTKKITDKAKVEAGRPSSGKLRVPLIRHEDRLAWFKRKSAEAGFSVDESRLQILPMPSFPLSDKISDSKSKGKLQGVRFSGILHVENPEKFREASAKGIGTAKSYGFGLLCLKPIDH